VTDALIETGSFTTPCAVNPEDGTIRVVSWNINRGNRLAELLESLRALNPDLLFLQEVDHGARRTGYRNIAAEIAEALRMNYVFGAEFQELADGRPNRPAFHGQATLCRSPIASYEVIRFDQQSGFWKPRWFIPQLPYFQRRAGGRMTLMVCTEILGTVFVTYNLHLESRAGIGLRIRQLEQVLLNASSQPEIAPVLIAGDFNSDLAQHPMADRLAGLILIPGPKPTPQVTTRSRWGGGRALDWIVVRGPIRVSSGDVHRRYRASDHFPVSFTLEIPERAEP
jgi:endonuclease/exonuclease/phosphatase family metal-dependent hydrolase